MIKRILSFSIVAVLLVACGGGDSTGQVEVKQAPGETPEDPLLEKATNIFYSMPSPLELTTLLKSAGGTFQPALLHDPEMAGKYQTQTKQSMNLGIYGADLSYASVYGQRQESIKHLAATKRIGDKLGINDAFSPELLERANANLDNRDSMLNILTEIYWQSNSQLKEEDRSAISVLIMASGWLEGLYLGSHIIDISNPDPEVALRIMEQKYTASQLKEMLTNTNNPAIEDIRLLFDDLFAFYEALPVEREKPVAEFVESTGVATISGKSRILYTNDELKELQSITADIRAKMVEL